jgi:protein-disulfide isomerase-like protein with CxxC motif
MTTTELAVTWDYRCPFARNFCEHVLAGLHAGAPWDVTFVPFSLEQVHVAEDEDDVWDDPGKAQALLAMQAGIAVRDSFPSHFLAVQGGLFAARHDHGLDLRETDVVRQVLAGTGVDADAVLAEVATGAPLETFRKEHEWAVAEHAVFGVPTVIAAGQATFVRVMHRPEGDAEVAVRTVERVLDLVTGWPDLNELKHTTIAR